MDEQNPRVSADEMRGRGDDRTAGHAAGERGPAGSTSEPETARAREIRMEIAHTRGELSETVNAVQDRLRPSNLASEATQSVKVNDVQQVVTEAVNMVQKIAAGEGGVG
jgi:hypothetical protein